jgi:hypothetical protein
MNDKRNLNRERILEVFRKNPDRPLTPSAILEATGIPRKSFFRLWKLLKDTDTIKRVSLGFVLGVTSSVTSSQTPILGVTSSVTSSQVTLGYSTCTNNRIENNKISSNELENNVQLNNIGVSLESVSLEPIEDKAMNIEQLKKHVEISQAMSASPIHSTTSVADGMDAINKLQAEFDSMSVTSSSAAPADLRLVQRKPKPKQGITTKDFANSKSYQALDKETQKRLSQYLLGSSKV